MYALFNKASFVVSLFSSFRFMKQNKRKYELKRILLTTCFFKELSFNQFSFIPFWLI